MPLPIAPVVVIEAKEREAAAQIVEAEVAVAAEREAVALETWPGLVSG
jgi:hypothetical protein